LIETRDQYGICFAPQANRQSEIAKPLSGAKWLAAIGSSSNAFVKALSSREFPFGARSKRPPRVLGFRDLLLFYVVTGISLRWIAAAAAAGPSSILIWIGAWLVFYTPLALCVIELSSRYPNEGGLYVWSKHAFGDFAGSECIYHPMRDTTSYFPLSVWRL
jgi:hypothetical protein